MKVEYSKDALNRFGKPKLVYGSGRDIFVFWKKTSHNQVEFQYTVTLYDPSTQTHSQVAVLHGFSHGDKVYIQRMQVDPHFRKRGLGNALHAFVQAEYKGKEIFLYSVPKARKFHEKAGFKTVRRAGREFYMQYVGTPSQNPVYIKPTFFERFKRYFRSKVSKYFKHK